MIHFYFSKFQIYLNNKYSKYILCVIAPTELFTGSIMYCVSTIIVILYCVSTMILIVYCVVTIILIMYCVSTITLNPLQVF